MVTPLVQQRYRDKVAIIEPHSALHTDRAEEFDSASFESRIRTARPSHATSTQLESGPVPLRLDRLQVNLSVAGALMVPPDGRGVMLPGA